LEIKRKLYEAGVNCITKSYIIPAPLRTVFVAEETNEGLGYPPRSWGMKRAYIGIVKENRKRLENCRN
jgi:hypothetical protein